MKKSSDCAFISLNYTHHYLMAIAPFFDLPEIFLIPTQLYHRLA